MINLLQQTRTQDWHNIAQKLLSATGTLAISCREKPLPAGRSRTISMANLGTPALARSMLFNSNSPTSVFWALNSLSP